MQELDLWPIWIEGGGRGGEGEGLEENRVELAENKLILDQFYSTLLYSPSLFLNPNRTLIPPLRER